MKRTKVKCAIKKGDRVIFHDSYYGEMEGIVDSISWRASGMTLLVPTARVKVTSYDTSLMKHLTGFESLDARDLKKTWTAKKFNKKRFFE
jgi:hypothetical protein